MLESSYFCGIIQIVTDLNIMTIDELIRLNRKIYGVGDDRLYSVDDLIYYIQKYLLRFIDNSSAKDQQAKQDLIASIFWFVALIYRYHIDIEHELWKHYSYKCPRCLDIPCSCENLDLGKSKKTGRPSSRKPINLSEWQTMISKIYPDETKTIIDNKLIKYLDKLAFCFRNYIRKPNDKNMVELMYRTADFFVLMLEAVNLLEIDLEITIPSMFGNGCYICHKAPCICNYSE
jgi:hypothetical protein